MVWLVQRRSSPWGVTWLVLPRMEAGLGECERSTPSRRMGIYFGLVAIRCLVSLSEIMVVTMERNYRERQGWNKWGDCLLCKQFQSKGIGKIKAFLVYQLVNLLSNSHVYSSLNTHLIEYLTHSRCIININWIRWLVNWSLNIRFFL